MEKVEETGLFRLTQTMSSLGASAETAQTLHQACTPALDRLRVYTNHTLHVAILDGNEVIYVERRESQEAMQMFRRVGSRNAVHSTSTGKVLVAYLPADEQAALVNSLRLVRKTPYTIVTKQRLQAELEQVRRQGFAENHSESEVGMSSIAAPIRDRNGSVVAAVSIVGQPADGDIGLKPLARPLIEAASRISHALGWKQ